MAFHSSSYHLENLDTRNAKTFRDLDVSPHDVTRGIIADLTLWSHRLKKVEDKVHTGLWRDYFTSRLV